MIERVEISELPEIERGRFSNDYEASLDLIKLLKSRCPYVDMRWDKAMGKMVLFEIQPWSGNLIDIAYYDYNKLGMYIADSLHGRTESNLSFVRRNREMREVKRLKELADAKYNMRGQVREDKKLWKQAEEAINSKGNIFKRGCENELWFQLAFGKTPPPSLS